MRTLCSTLVLSVLMAGFLGSSAFARHDTIGPIAPPLQNIGEPCSQSRECATNFCQGGDDSAPPDVHNGTCQPSARALSCTEYCSSISNADPIDDLSLPENKICVCNPLTTVKFTDVVDRILNILFFIALAVSPVMIIVAGFRFLTGGGDPKNITAARQMLIWTAVGFGIILLSKGIVLILRNVIGF